MILFMRPSNSLTGLNNYFKERLISERKTMLGDVRLGVEAAGSEFKLQRAAASGDNLKVELQTRKRDCGWAHLITVLNRGLESPRNPQAGKPALRTASRPDSQPP